MYNSIQKKKINIKAKSILESLKLDDRVEQLEKDSGFTPCRIVNPSQNEIRKASKAISDKINQNLQNILQITQCKNSKDIIK